MCNQTYLLAAAVLILLFVSYKSSGFLSTKFDSNELMWQGPNVALSCLTTPGQEHCGSVFRSFRK